MCQTSSMKHGQFHTKTKWCVIWHHFYRERIEFIENHHSIIINCVFLALHVPICHMTLAIYVEKLWMRLRKNNNNNRYVEKRATRDTQRKWEKRNGKWRKIVIVKPLTKIEDRMDRVSKRRRERNHPTHTVPTKKISENIQSGTETEKSLNHNTEKSKCFMCLALALQVKNVYNTMCKI